MPELLDRLLQEPYLALPPPKSTGRELFNRAWLQTALDGHAASVADVQATLCEFTAATIADGIAGAGLRALASCWCAVAARSMAN